MATVTATSNTMVAELWRECAAWLTRCNIIPNDHRANHLDSDIKVLATILRDGVLLCNLANFFDPSSFDRKDFNRKPQMAHVCILKCCDMANEISTCILLSLNYKTQINSIFFSFFAYKILNCF